MQFHPLYPNALITTNAVASLLGDPRYRIIEVDQDSTRYADGHIPGAIGWDWERQLRDPQTHEIVTPEVFAQLLGQSGVDREHRIILYGDNNNWFACWAFWLLSMMGHEHVWMMDGGGRKWNTEERRCEVAVPRYKRCHYGDPKYDRSYQATAENVIEAIFHPETHRLIDVRSPAEFEGRLLSPAGVEARCAVGGHIPTSVNIPWSMNCNPDGTFRPREELEEMYDSFGITHGSAVITYCAIGERASLGWFVLKVLLGHSTAMNYDRSMAQWSRLEDAPVVKLQVA